MKFQSELTEEGVGTYAMKDSVFVEECKSLVRISIFWWYLVP